MNYGDSWAPVYDRLYADREDVATIVKFVGARAEPKSVLELGVGTGRLAIPLSASGLTVQGIDNSPAMLDLLRSKPGGSAITAHLGDMAQPSMTGTFGCVLTAFSTIYLLRDQAAQLRCLGSAADRLAHSGCVIVEGFLPDPDRWHRGQSLTIDRWQGSDLSCTVGRIDVAEQVIETIHIEVNDQMPMVLLNRLRYLWPAELDLLADRVGLYLDERYAGFERSPMTSAATTHVSVYRKR